MGINFRRAKTFGAVRVNMSKRGIGVSTGIKGLRVGVGPRGTRVTSSIPGTGIYSTKVYSGRKSRAIGTDAIDGVKIPHAQPMPLTTFIFLLAVLSCVIAFLVSRSDPELFGQGFLRGIGAMFATLIVGIVIYAVWWDRRSKRIKSIYLPILEAYVAVGDAKKALAKAKSVREMVAQMNAIDKSMQIITDFAQDGIVVSDIDPFDARQFYEKEGHQAILAHLDRSYKAMLEGASLLKTEKGKANRRSKFFEELHEDIDGLPLPSEAMDFIKRIEADA